MYYELVTILRCEDITTNSSNRYYRYLNLIDDENKVPLARISEIKKPVRGRAGI